MKRFTNTLLFLMLLSSNLFAGGKFGIGLNLNWEKVVFWDYKKSNGNLTYEGTFYPVFFKYGLNGSYNLKTTSIGLGILYSNENLIGVSYMTGCARCFSGGKDFYYRNLSFPLSVTKSFSKNYNSTAFIQLSFEIINTLYFRQDSIYARERSSIISKKIELNRIPAYFAFGYKFRLGGDIYILTGLNFNLGNVYFNSTLNRDIKSNRLKLSVELRQEF